MCRSSSAPPFSRKLRFPFGELAWDALDWYLHGLQWPKNDNSLGVTWIELALDFEISTGLTLPRGAAVCEMYGRGEHGRHFAAICNVQPCPCILVVQWIG